MRDEVGDVIADRSLSAEIEPGETIRFQVSPQKSLRARHGAPELFGAGALNR